MKGIVVYAGLSWGLFFPSCVFAQSLWEDFNFCIPSAIGYWNPEENMTPLWEETENLEKGNMLWDPQGLSFTMDVQNSSRYLITIPPEIISIPELVLLPEVEPPSLEEQRIPLVLKVLDEEKKRIKLVLGNEKLSFVGFIIQPDGIYDLEGNFQDGDLEFKWGGTRYKLTVWEEEGKLEINIAPLSSYSPIKMSYYKNFFLGTFPGKIGVGVREGQPVLELELGEKEQEFLELGASPEEVSLALDVRILSSGEGAFNIRVDSVKIEDFHLQGEGRLTLERDNRIVAFSYRLGEEPYLEIAQNKTLDEIIDEFLTEMAEAFYEIEFGGCPDAQAPPELVQEIKNYFYRLFGEDKLELLKLIEDVNTRREGIIVPENMRIYIDFSPPERAEFIFPILPRRAALKLKTEGGEREISFIGALENGKNIEVGYREGFSGTMMFKFADLPARSMIALEVSEQGVRSFRWNLGNLEGGFYPRGFYWGSSSDFYLGPLLEFLQRGPEDLEWRLGYDSPEGWSLDLKLPLDRFLYAYGYLSLNWGKGGLGFGLKLPFIYQGILEVNTQGIKYTLHRKGIYLKVEGDAEGLDIEFEIPPSKEKASDSPS